MDRQPSLLIFHLIYSSKVLYRNDISGCFKVHHKRVSSSPQQQQKIRFHKILYNNSINRASLNEIKMTLIEVSRSIWNLFTQSTLALLCLISHSDADLQATIANRDWALSLFFFISFCFSSLLLLSKAENIVCS